MMPRLDPQSDILVDHENPTYVHRDAEGYLSFQFHFLSGPFPHPVSRQAVPDSSCILSEQKKDLAQATKARQDESGWCRFHARPHPSGLGYVVDKRLNGPTYVAVNQYGEYLSVDGDDPEWVNLPSNHKHGIYVPESCVLSEEEVALWRGRVDADVLFCDHTRIICSAIPYQRTEDGALETAEYEGDVVEWGVEVKVEDAFSHEVDIIFEQDGLNEDQMNEICSQQRAIFPGAENAEAPKLKAGERPQPLTL